MTSIVSITYVQQKIERHYKKLKDENQKTKTLLQLKGGLLHQINNPLAIISGVVNSKNLESKREMLSVNIERITTIMQKLRDLDNISELELQQYPDNLEVYMVNTDSESGDRHKN